MKSKQAASRPNHRRIAEHLINKYKQLLEAYMELEVKFHNASSAVVSLLTENEEYDRTIRVLLEQVEQLRAA